MFILISTIKFEYKKKMKKEKTLEMNMKNYDHGQIQKWTTFFDFNFYENGSLLFFFTLKSFGIFIRIIRIVLT